MDALLAKHPELAERWGQQTEGLRKLEEKAAATIANAQPLAEWGAALADPATVADAFQEMGRRLGAHFGIDLLGDVAQPAQDADDDYIAQGYDSPGELKLARELQALKRQLAQTAQTTKAETRAQSEQRAQAEEKARFEQAVDRIAPKVVERIKALDDGWTVTRDMVAEAVRRLPQLRDKPSEAVRKWFSDERAKHVASRTKPTRAPSMVSGKTSAPKGVPSAESGSAAAILAAMGIRE